jgi:L-alanine-DL-glutamate epimerase-like enolase superfamily enzyme
MEDKMRRCYLLAVPVNFRIALARILFSQHLFVQLNSNGLTGTGEGVLYRAKPHQASRLLQRVVLPWWERNCEEQVPLDWAEQARQWASISPAVAYTMDTALWDLRGRADGQSLSAMLGGVQHPQVDLTEQIFIHDWSTAEAELSAILARGTRRLKLKIGINPRADLEVVRAVWAFVGPNVELRVDANHAYSLDESESLYRQLADLGVLAFEEPLRLHDWAALRALRQRLGVPVILDESILSLNDLEAAIAGQALDILNVKLTRVGGVTLAREYIDLCQKHGIGVAIGCNEDLGISTAAIVHLAASLTDYHSVEGVGPLRLGFDVVRPAWSVQNGALSVPKGPGIGVTLGEDWLAHVPDHVQRFDLIGQPARLWAFSHYSRFLQRAENVRVRIARRFG